ALHVTDGLDEALVKRGLDNDQPHVRAWTIQLATEAPGKKVPPAQLQQFARLAASDPSPVVRLYLASAAGRLPVDNRWEIVAGLLAHSEDAGDHNLPLMDWYAAEPLVGRDAAKALELAAAGKIPQVFSFTVRLLTKIGKPEALELLVAQLGRTSDVE